MKHLIAIVTLSTSLALLLLASPTQAQDGISEGPVTPAPALDLDTLRAETPAGPVQAEPYPWSDTYVGAVDDELYIAVSLSESRPQEVTVYLCDSEEMGELLTGEVGAEATTLEGETLSVEFSLADDTVWGTVALDGEVPQPFTAEEASGTAGLYRAEAAFDDTAYWAGWVVLPDGSQRGYMGPCLPGMPGWPFCGVPN